MHTDCTDRPIPPARFSGTALDYHDIPIRSDHPLSGEALADVAEYGLASESYYARADGWNPPYYRPMPGALGAVWCRRSVAAALARVNASVARYGLRVFLLDAYRPVALQRSLWDFFMERARGQVADPTEENRRRFVGRYWSDPSKFDPDDFRTWPTHATGGAVDLTLQRVATGEFLYMGGIFDDTAEVSHTRFYEPE
jgi:D-alanyl-D-alanine dipeptidase